MWVLGYQKKTYDIDVVVITSVTTINKAHEIFMYKVNEIPHGW